MKGLMVKDLLLLKNQSKFFLLIAAIAVIMVVSGMDASFINMYITFIFSGFVLSTLSYDEFDNGYPYLLALPVNRKGYVSEKYLFCLLMASVSCVVSLLLVVLVLMFQKQPILVGDLVATAIGNLLVVLIFFGISIPIRLKLGAEKGKYVYFGIAGVVAVLSLIGKEALERAPETTVTQINMWIDRMLPFLGVILIIGAIVVLVGSYLISLQIMKKKEF